MADEAGGEKKSYGYTGTYNRTTFSQKYQDEFKAVPKFNLASQTDLIFLLNNIGADPRIVDIRWAAYMLAAAFIESSHTVKITKYTLDKKHKVKAHTVIVWRNFTPSMRRGAGRCCFTVCPSR
jgi:hypothetical protein